MVMIDANICFLSPNGLFANIETVELWFWWTNSWPSAFEVMTRLILYCCRICTVLAPKRLWKPNIGGVHAE